MDSKLNLSQLKTLMTIFNNNSEKIQNYSILFNIKAQKLPSKMTTIGFSLSPKILDKALYDSYKDYQIEYNNVFSKAIENFDVVRHYLKKFCSKNEMIEKLLKLDLEVEEYKKGKKELYNGKGEVHGNIYRNDFMYDKQDEQLYQVEINTIAAGMHYIGQRLEEMIRMLYIEFDLNDIFPSNINAYFKNYVYILSY